MTNEASAIPATLPCVRCKGQTSYWDATHKNVFSFYPTAEERIACGIGRANMIGHDNPAWLTQYDAWTALLTRVRGIARDLGLDYYRIDGEDYYGHNRPHRTDPPCQACKGRGTWDAPDVDAILATISAGQKSKTGRKPTFRKSWPSTTDRSTVEGSRAYFVWRLARFHGGADVTLPMTAETLSSADPYRAYLDRIAENVAAHVFGTDRAGAYRWGQALGAIQPSQVPANLPPTAYESGPVHDGNKPADEVYETR